MMPPPKSSPYLQVNVRILRTDMVALAYYLRSLGIPASSRAQVVHACMASLVHNLREQGVLAKFHPTPEQVDLEVQLMSEYAKSKFLQNCIAQRVPVAVDIPAAQTSVTISAEQLDELTNLLDDED